VEAGCHDDARELFHLALELTADLHLAAELHQRLETVSLAPFMPKDTDFPGMDLPETAAPDEADAGSDEEYFEALCNALDDTERDAYTHFPDPFKQGFIALNRGDFHTAVSLLSEALQNDSSTTNYIALELATAYLNLGKNEQAQTLLEQFLAKYPHILRGYDLLCEILWENEDYKAAQKLLSACPHDLAKTPPVKMLEGETLLRAHQFEQAVVFFSGLLKSSGWQPHFAPGPGQRP
jgi:tetratricopeptide (TPR) repeat protein